MKMRTRICSPSRTLTFHPLSCSASHERARPEETESARGEAQCDCRDDVGEGNHPTALAHVGKSLVIEGGVGRKSAENARRERQTQRRRQKLGGKSDVHED